MARHIRWQYGEYTIDMECVLSPRENWNQLRNSPELQAYMQELGEQVAARAGEDFEANTQPGKTRAHTIVKNNAPYKGEVTDNRLLNALG